MVLWVKGAFWRNCRPKVCLVLWHLWIGRARHPGPSTRHLAVEVFNVGGWLTHGDLVLEALVDFLAVVEHGFIPARFRSEWTRLRAKGLASVWAPACQDSSHVGHAGAGFISMRGAPVSLPTFATAQLKRFFDSGRAVRCILPLGSGRFMHSVVLCGYPGADSDAEQLAFTEQLFDAALGELGVVALDQPCLIVGDFNVEPTKIPCLAKGISAGLTWNLLGLLLVVGSLASLASVPGVLLVVIVGILWWVALLWLLLSPLVLSSRIGGLCLILLLGPILTVLGGLVRLLSQFSVRHATVARFLVACLGQK